MKPETTYHAILGQVIGELRKNKGFDQVHMAKKMGMKNKSSWSRIENGIAMVNIHQLKDIAKILESDADTILEKVDDIIKKLEEKDYTVRYEPIKTKSSGAKGLALLGGAVLALVVGSVLFANDTEDDDKNKNE